MLNYNDLAAEYTRHRRVHPGVLRALIADAGLTAASRVLEVGCGTGNYTVALTEATGCTCEGIDPSAEMLARLRASAPRVRAQVGRAERLDVPPHTFDVVFSVDVIHHVADRAAAYAEARRVLRSGGLVCTVTDSEDIIRRREPLAVYFPESVEVELRRYPPISALTDLMREAGFRGLREERVEFAYGLTDATPYRDRAFSSLHLIPEDAFQRGLARMERDLRAGPIPCVSRYLLLWGVK
ncbi:MAG: methyltransferase domain-containing protein [Anaerolineae bacterium]